MERFSVKLDESLFSPKEINDHVPGGILSNIAFSLDLTLREDEAALIKKYFFTADDVKHDPTQNSVTLFFTEEGARGFMGYSISEEEPVTQKKIEQAVTHHILRRLQKRLERGGIKIQIDNEATEPDHTIVQKGDSKIRSCLSIFVGVLVCLVIFCVGLHFNRRTECKDGWRSPSIGLQGACSYHGGVQKSALGLNLMLISPLVGGVTWFLLSPQKISGKPKKNS